MLCFHSSEMRYLAAFAFVRKSRGNGCVPATRSKDQPALTINDERETSNDVDYMLSVDV